MRIFGVKPSPPTKYRRPRAAASSQFRFDSSDHRNIQEYEGVLPHDTLQSYTNLLVSDCFQVSIQHLLRYPVAADHLFS